MSIDKLISDFMSTAATLTEALNRNSENLERVIAGQEAAMAKLDGATGTSTRKPRQPKPATEADNNASGGGGAPAADPAPETKVQSAPVTVHPLLAGAVAEMSKVKNAKTGVDEDTPTANYRASDFSRDQVKNEFIGWLGETTDAAVRKERAEFVAAVGQHFGVKQPFHPTDGLADDEQRKQTLFYLRRKRGGLDVNFSADYDFDEDPLADHGGAGNSDDVDELDALG